MIDYGRRARLKILGRLSMREVSVDDPQLQALVEPELRARTRRLMMIHVEAWDRNCPSFIPRLAAADPRA